MRMRRSLNGAIAGAVAAAAWAAQQPLDRRLFRYPYDDVELLGKAITRERQWPLAGLALHLQNGAAFGALYAHVKPLLPGGPAARGVIAALAEHAGTWPLARLVDRHHPARSELARLAGSGRAHLQAVWRHAVFGVTLGVVEHRLNADPGDEPPPVPVSSNGHGQIEVPAGVA